MVPPHSLRIPRARRYSGYCCLTLTSPKGLSPSTVPLPNGFGSSLSIAYAVHTPEALLSPVWPFPRSLATTCGISFDFSSSPYLDVSVREVPHLKLCIYFRLHDSSSCGFPHSEICGSKLICSSPQLIAACHVLHRLLMPRHSPCALVRLNSFYILFDIFWILVFYA